jgi:hypothetical protein
VSNDAEPRFLRCCRCGELKPADDFAWRRRRKLQRDTYCRPCRSAYVKEHYAANKQRYIENAEAIRSKLRLERTRFLIEYFRSHPCTDCGESDPVVLEFDHLRDKAFDIGGHLVNVGWQKLLAEIAKCEVVCANCHRRRTASRRGALRLILNGTET